MANKINYTGSSKILQRICEAINSLIDGGISLPTASASVKGGVKIGEGLSMNGEILNNSNPTPYTLPTASTSVKGGVKVGDGLSMSGDTLNNDNPTPYTLPKATAFSLGGIIVGDGLSINSYGVLSATGGGGGGSTVTITPTLSSGTKIADFEIDGTSGELYAPSSGGGGGGSSERVLSTVTVPSGLTTFAETVEYLSTLLSVAVQLTDAEYRQSKLILSIDYSDGGGTEQTYKYVLCPCLAFYTDSSDPQSVSRRYTTSYLDWSEQYAYSILLEENYISIDYMYAVVSTSGISPQSVMYMPDNDSVNTLDDLFGSYAEDYTFTLVTTAPASN